MKGERVGTIHIAKRPLGTIVTRKTESIQQDSDDEEGDSDEEGEGEEQEDPVELIKCPVILESFNSLSRDPQRHAHWRDKVQSFRFADFEGLDEFMLRLPLSSSSSSSSLRDLILQRHAPTLRLVHETFQPIVQEIIETKHLAASLFHDEEEENRHSVAPFATPNVRLHRGTYATFLHSDAVFGEKKQSNRAMINIWMPLTDTPCSQFPLCFHECDRTKTRFAENKLYYCADNDDVYDDSHPKDSLRMLYDPTLAWGSFLCFVAGQPVSSDRVILHGAVQLEESTTPLSQPSSLSTNSEENTLEDHLPVVRCLEPTTAPVETSRHSGRRWKGRANTQSSCQQAHHHRGTIEEPRKSMELRFLL